MALVHHRTSPILLVSKPLVVLVVIESQQKLWFLEASNYRFSLFGHQRPTPPPPLEICHEDLPEFAFDWTRSHRKIPPPVVVVACEIYTLEGAFFVISSEI